MRGVRISYLVEHTQNTFRSWGSGCLMVVLSSLIIVVALTLNLPNTAKAAEPCKTKATMEGRVQELIPDIEAYITSGMKGFDVPGLAIGIVANNRLIYAKGFGVRSKSNGLPVDTRTDSQIGR